MAALSCMSKLIPTGSNNKIEIGSKATNWDLELNFTSPDQQLLKKQEISKTIWMVRVHAWDISASVKASVVWRLKGCHIICHMQGHYHYRVFTSQIYVLDYRERHLSMFTYITESDQCPSSIQIAYHLQVGLRFCCLTAPSLKFSGWASVVQDSRIDAVLVDCAEYTADTTITDSDHKPVWCRLTVDLPVVIQEQKRRKCSELLQQCFQDSLPEKPQVTLSTEIVTIQPVCATVRTPYKGLAKLVCKIWRRHAFEKTALTNTPLKSFRKRKRVAMPLVSSYSLEYLHMKTPPRQRPFWMPKRYLNDSSKADLSQ